MTTDETPPLPLIARASHPHKLPPPPILSPELISSLSKAPKSRVFRSKSESSLCGKEVGTTVSHRPLQFHCPVQISGSVNARINGSTSEIVEELGINGSTGEIVEELGINGSTSEIDEENKGPQTSEIKEVQEDAAKTSEIKEVQEGDAKNVGIKLGKKKAKLGRKGDRKSKKGDDNDKISPKDIAGWLFAIITAFLIIMTNIFGNFLSSSKEKLCKFKWGGVAAAAYVSILGSIFVVCMIFRMKMLRMLMWKLVKTREGRLLKAYNQFEAAVVVLSIALIIAMVATSLTLCGFEKAKDSPPRV